MEVLYDHQAFTIQEYGGISRYFYELTTQLQNTEGIKVQSSLLFSNNEYIKGNQSISSSSFLKCLRFQKKTVAMNLLNEVKSKLIFRRNNFDIFHPTYYDPYYLNLKSKKPIVITFHDLIHEKFMQYDFKTISNKIAVLNRADKVIAISENSKRDLMEHFRIPEKRITVIHLASSFETQEGQVRKAPERDYLLYVGSRAHYKNFIFFVKAIVPVLQEYSGLSLCCAGGGPFSKEELLLFQELHILNRVKYDRGSDEILKELYSCAIAFFFPSMYEGFGLPLLEAMNCGCPIGASHTSSLPEVGGDAALYFNPYDRKSILTVAQNLVASPEIRASLQQKGFERAREFSWKKTAQLTRDVYSAMV